MTQQELDKLNEEVKRIREKQGSKFAEIKILQMKLDESVKEFIQIDGEILALEKLIDSELKEEK